MRTPQGAAAKRRVTLRLDPDVLDPFRAGGPGWHGRINATLRKAVKVVIIMPIPEDDYPAQSDLLPISYRIEGKDQ